MDEAKYLSLAAECDERAEKFESGELVAVTNGENVSAEWAKNDRDLADGWRRTAQFFREQGQ